MEERVEKKKLISIIVTLCSLSLALIFSVSTFAWMSTNRKLTATGLWVTASKNTDLGIYNIQIYKREGADNARDVSKEGTVVLSEYDTIFTDKNVNTSIIMRLELGGLPYENGKYQPFHLRVRCTGTDNYMVATEKTEDDVIEGGNLLPESYWKTDDSLSQVLSNIIGIRCGLGDSTLNSISLDDPNSIYTTAKDYLEHPSGTSVLDEQVFLNKTGTEKRAILQFKFENYDSLVEDGTVIVYIDVNYNDSLIALFSNQLGFSTTSFDDGTSSEESVHFGSDLTNCFIFM